MEEFNPSNWRLLRDLPAPGAWNMAVDEAILEAVCNDQAPPTLRLYAWDPYCLSIGFSQSISDIALDNLVARNIGLVRRSTGGRAILHTDELTYSVIGPPTDPRLTGSVLDTYRRIAQALTRALSRLNIAAHEHQDFENGGQVHSRLEGPICFDVPSNYEIMVNGKKILGSAQARRKGGVLQHGSLPLSGNVDSITQVLNYRDKLDRNSAIERILERATTVERVLGYQVGWNSVANEFESAFSTVLNLNLIPGKLSPGEIDRAYLLSNEKFAYYEWTNRI